MDSSGRNDRPWILDYSYPNSHTDQTGSEGCLGLFSAHDSGLSGGHGQGVNPTRVTSIAYPRPSIPRPPFSYLKTFDEGPSFHSRQQGSTYTIPPPDLFCDYTSEVLLTTNDKFLCVSGENEDAGASPAAIGSPSEQRDAQFPSCTIQAVPRPMSRPASYMQPPCASVVSSPLKNSAAITSASSGPFVVLDDVIYDTRWNQDVSMYPVYHTQLDAQVAWLSTFHRPLAEMFMALYILQAALGLMLSNTDDKKLTSVAPSLFEDKASMSKGPTHKKDKNCPICAASLGRWQDKKRHMISHLPHWLQCQVPGCPWRGDRWEHLRKHCLKAHPSSSQESDTVTSEDIIYDPRPLVEGITDKTTFENAKTIAFSFVAKKANDLGKLELWGDLCGRRRRRSRKVHSQSPK